MLKEIKNNFSLFNSIRFNLLFLTDIVKDCEKILDIGCGKNSPIKYLTFLERSGIDAYEKDLQIAKTNRTHDNFLHANVENLMDSLSGNKYDCVIAYDLIEHLSKVDGLNLIKNMEDSAIKKIIIYTPNGFLAQPSLESGDFQMHRSGWGIDEFKNMGFSIYGMLGPKILRGTFHQLVFRPMFMWAFVSYILQKIWYFKHPKNSAAVLCIKNIN